MQRTALILLFVSLFTTSAVSQSSALKLGTIYSDQYGKKLNYLYYKPRNIGPNDSIPLLIYLHSSESINEDPFAIANTGFLSQDNQFTTLPFFILAPQLPFEANKEWDPEFVDIFITHILKNNKLDSNRVYITGFSIGATGAWNYACAYPEKIACLVPISGWGDPQEMCAIKKVPTWVFHGSADKVVSPIASRNLVNALQNCGGDVILTELSGVGHNAWQQAYSTPYLFDWIASKSLKNDAKKISVKINENLTAFPLPKALHTIKGLVYIDNFQFYGISEKGNSATLVTFDTVGNISSMQRIMGAANLQWEELIKDSIGNLYILDGGNKTGKRKEFQIYTLPANELANSIITCSAATFMVDNNITFTSFFWIEDELMLIGQDESSTKIRFYRYRKGAQINTYPEPILTIDIQMLSKVTSSRYVEEDGSLLLLGPEGIVILDSFSLDTPVKPRIITQFQHPVKKEALEWLGKGRIAYADQYFFGKIDGNLYIHQLKD